MIRINMEAANYSPSSPGLPIAYTLRYLRNREVAAMSYTVTYDKKDCTTTLARDAKIEFALDDVWKQAQIWVNGTWRLTQDRNKHGANTGKVDLTPWLNSNANNKVEIKLYLPSLTTAHLGLTIYKDGAKQGNRRYEAQATLSDKCSSTTPFWVWT